MRSRVPAVAVLVSLVLALAATPAGAGTDAEAATGFVTRLNAARSEAGLAPLAVASDLADVAQRHAVRMADAANLHHNPALTSEVTGWGKVGENVGRGPSVETVHDALWASPSHRANLLDPAFTQVGIAVESRDGHLWVTQVFRRPQAPDGPAVDPPVEAVAAEATPVAPTSPPVTAVAAPRTESTLDHTTIMLARLEAAEQAVSLSDLLGP